MIKVEIAGTIFYCGTAQEAVDVHTLLSRKNGLNGSNGAKPSAVADSEKSWFVNLLKNLPSNEVTSSDLMGALNVESTNGLGPKMRGLSKRFEEVFHRPLDTVLVRDARPGKPVTWRVDRRVVENL